MKKGRGRKPGPCLLGVIINEAVVIAEVVAIAEEADDVAVALNEWDKNFQRMWYRALRPKARWGLYSGLVLFTELPGRGLCGHPYSLEPIVMRQDRGYGRFIPRPRSYSAAPLVGEDRSLHPTLDARSAVLDAPVVGAEPRSGGRVPADR